ncbi:MAG: response regulator transcription factor [Clostridia bacterium]|nr:response regulator transcription factor [Clostridia bacterium]
MEDNYEYEKKTILIVDDEQKIVDLLVHNLKKEGYETIEANDGQTAIEIALEKRPNLILLDVMLPRVDGLSVCKKIKNAYNVPILMISAKDDELDKIVGLELGADDYITKPFSVREVVARVKANLRKVEANIEEQVAAQKNQEKKDQKKESTIKVGSLILDLEKYEVHIDGKVINLTLREFEVLKFLAQQPGQVVTRESLLERVWGYEYYGDIRTVDVTVRRIRERIEKDTSNPQILITKRGVGYYIPNK